MTTIEGQSPSRAHAHRKPRASRGPRSRQIGALLAVSKTFPDAVRGGGVAAGQHAFGENYIQEAVDKMAALADLPIVWHCIGPIQSNKTRLVAEHFRLGAHRWTGSRSRSG
jgi:uncharacterized pyridoxal phosphate-containing UPF0001 family protein